MESEPKPSSGAKYCPSALTMAEVLGTADTNATKPTPNAKRSPSASRAHTNGPPSSGYALPKRPYVQATGKSSSAVTTKASAEAAPGTTLASSAGATKMPTPTMPLMPSVSSDQKPSTRRPGSGESAAP